MKRNHVNFSFGEIMGGRRKRLIFTLFGIVSAFVFLSSPASAAPFTWTDTFNPDDVLIGWGESYSYVHNLTNSNPPFEPGVDFITGYTLTLSLYDDNKGRDEFLGPEIAYINLPGLISDGFYDFSMASNNYGWSLAGFLSLNSSGTYNVTIASLWGDFYFASSTLTASGFNNTAPVPEPASMLLFGTGLIVFGFAGRKFKTR